MSKHIFLCTDDPGVGGVAQYNHLILCGLVRLGYRVTCVQSGASNKLITDQDTLGIQPHQWIKANTVEDCQRILTNPSAQADLLICSNSNPFSNFTIKQIASKYLAIAPTIACRTLQHHWFVLASAQTATEKPIPSA